MAISAHGTLLKIGDGGGTEVFTTIAEVRTIGGPKIEAIIKEVTHHSSAGWVEKLPVLLDAGDVEFEVNFLPTDATHSYSTGLIKDLVNKTKRNFKLVFPDGGSTTWTFSAYVSNFEPDENADEELMASFTLSITGAPTLA